MEYIYIGKIVNTHGIKGELRILSDFEKKEKVFKKGTILYIGAQKFKEQINSYRHHKMFEMITLDNYTNINEVLKYKNQSVYVTRESLNLQDDEYLYEDLIGLNIVDQEKIIGKVKEIVYNKNNVLLYIEASKNFYIPLNNRFIKKVDKKNEKIYVVDTKGLIL